MIALLKEIGRRAGEDSYSLTLQPVAVDAASADARPLATSNNDSARDRFLIRVRKILDDAQGERSNKQFAKDLLTSDTVIYKLKHGVKRCSEDKLVKLAAIIGCKPRDLYRAEYDRSKRTPLYYCGAHVMASGI